LSKALRKKITLTAWYKLKMLRGGHGRKEAKAGKKIQI
jgi:hypothetical protein